MKTAAVNNHKNLFSIAPATSPKETPKFNAYRASTTNALRQKKILCTLNKPQPVHTSHLQINKSSFSQVVDNLTNPKRSFLQ